MLDRLKEQLNTRTIILLVLLVMVGAGSGIWYFLTGNGSKSSDNTVLPPLTTIAKNRSSRKIVKNKDIQNQPVQPVQTSEMQTQVTSNKPSESKKIKNQAEHLYSLVVEKKILEVKKDIEKLRTEIEEAKTKRTSAGILMPGNMDVEGNLFRSRNPVADSTMNMPMPFNRSFDRNETTDRNEEEIKDNKVNPVNSPINRIVLAGVIPDKKVAIIDVIKFPAKGKEQLIVSEGQTIMAGRVKVVKVNANNIVVKDTDGNTCSVYIN